MAQRYTSIAPLRLALSQAAPRPVRRLREKSVSLIVSCAAVFVLTFAGGLALIAPPSPGEPVVAETISVARVIDGDTLVLSDGERVRIENIDTAEMPPKSRCPYEERMAVRAKARLGDLVAAGGSITLTRTSRERDPYGRLLRRVRIDGADVGDQLVREGLAKRWMGRKATWC